MFLCLLSSDGSRRRGERSEHAVALRLVALRIPLGLFRLSRELGRLRDVRVELAFQLANARTESGARLLCGTPSGLLPLPLGPFGGLALFALGARCGFFARGERLLLGHLACLRELREP